MLDRKELGATWSAMVDAKPRIVVVGDVMLDVYFYILSMRTNPDACETIYLQDDRIDMRVGGAGAVATMLAAFGCDVSLVGFAGADQEGETLRSLVAAAGIGGKLFKGADDNRPTTRKLRIQTGYHGIRLDREATTPIDGICSVGYCGTHVPLSGSVIRYFETLDSMSAVICSDYGKGFLGPGLSQELVRICKDAGVPVVVDPAKTDNLEDWQQWRGVWGFKPNRREAVRANGAVSAASLRSKLGVDNCFVTLDSDGVAISTPSQNEIVPVQQITDAEITGAGDMFAAVLGMAAASGVDPFQAAEIANVAAGLTCLFPGVTCLAPSLVSDCLAGDFEMKKAG